MTLLPEHQPLLPGPVLAVQPLQALQRPCTETINMIVENKQLHYFQLQMITSINSQYNL